jgi:hypothetical protein
MVGVMNWIVQKTMINEAKRIARKVKDKYDYIKKTSRYGLYGPLY